MSHRDKTQVKEDDDQDVEIIFEDDDADGAANVDSVDAALLLLLQHKTQDHLKKNQADVDRRSRAEDANIVSIDISSKVRDACESFLLELDMYVLPSASSSSSSSDTFSASSSRPAANVLLHRSGAVLLHQDHQKLVSSVMQRYQHQPQPTKEILESATRIALSEWSDLCSELWSVDDEMSLAGAFLLSLSVAPSQEQQQQQQQSNTNTFLVPSAVTLPAVASFASSVLIDSAAVALERCISAHTTADAAAFNRIISSLCTTLFPTIHHCALLDAASIGRRLSNHTTASAAATTTGGAPDYSGAAALIAAGCWMAAIPPPSAAAVFTTQAEHVVGQVAVALRSRLAGCKTIVRRALRSVAARSTTHDSNNNNNNNNNSNTAGELVATALSKSLSHWAQVAPSRRAFVSPPDPHALNFELMGSASVTRSKSTSPVFSQSQQQQPPAAAAVRHFHFATPTVPNHQQSAMLLSTSISPANNCE